MFDIFLNKWVYISELPLVLHDVAHFFNRIDLKVIDEEILALQDMKNKA